MTATEYGAPCIRPACDAGDRAFGFCGDYSDLFEFEYDGGLWVTDRAVMWRNEWCRRWSAWPDPLPRYEAPEKQLRAILTRGGWPIKRTMWAHRHRSGWESLWVRADGRPVWVNADVTAEIPADGVTFEQDAELEPIRVLDAAGEVVGAIMPKARLVSEDPPDLSVFETVTDWSYAIRDDPFHTTPAAD